MASTHAFKILEQTTFQVPDVIAVYGQDASLRTWVIQRLTASGDLMQVNGDSTEWSDLRDELSTASLFDFGDGKKTIVIRDADSFVSTYRGELESYLSNPSTATRLVLELDSLASNTRLYKLIDKNLSLIHI